MKLRSITLDNVRRFTDPVRVGPIGDGVTLLCEPNEAGKSTLFDALHALFFLKHGSQAGEVKTLRPHSGGKIAIEATLDHEDAIWRIRKEWLVGASAKVWREDTLLHQGDAAEDWIAALIAGDAGGPGGLLWVRQGRVSLQANTKAEREAEFEKRRDLLTAISGAMAQVTGGEKMDRIRARVEADLARLQTSSGRPKSGGRWADAKDAVETLMAEAQDLEKLVESLRSDLDNARRLRSNLAELESTEAEDKRKADLAEAEAALQQAEGQAQELETAATQAKLAQLQADNAQEESNRKAHLWSTAKAAQTAHDTALAHKQDIVEKAAQTRQTLQDAQAAVAQAAATHAEAQTTLRRVEAAERSAQTQAERQQLAALIIQVETADAERIAQRALAAKGPSPQIVGQIDQLARAVATSQAVRDAAAPQVSMRYAPDAPLVSLAGVPLPKGASRALPLDGLIALPGIGEMHIETADKDAQITLDKAKDALARALAEGGWDNMDGLHLAARGCAEAARLAELAEKTIATLAPDGLAQLKLRLAGLSEEVAPEAADLPPRTVAEDALNAAEAALSERQEDVQRLDSIHQTTALSAAKAEAAFDAAAQAMRSALRAVEGLTAPDPQAEAEHLTALRTAADNAQRAYDERAAHAPDTEGLRARAARLKMVIQTVAEDSSRIRAEISKLEGRIETRGDEGVEEALEDVRGRLDAAEATLENVVFEKDVLARLLSALDEAQKAARETYFAPVAAELRPLLAELWEDAELQWSDDTLLPVALVRKGTQEPLDVLSGGTQEQIAFLVRLAFARLLAQSGRHAPLILDDALVYSDDDRIERMFDALHGAAQDLQIIVLSCRQRAFRDLGAPSLGFTPLSQPGG